MTAKLRHNTTQRDIGASTVILMPSLEVRAIDALLVMQTPIAARELQVSLGIHEEFGDIFISAMLKAKKIIRLPSGQIAVSASELLRRGELSRPSPSPLLPSPLLST